MRVLGQADTMSMIEGIGDEVTICFLAFLLFLVLTIAWISTQVSEQPLINIIVLDRATFQRLLSRLSLRVQRIANGGRVGAVSGAGNASERERSETPNSSPQDESSEREPPDASSHNPTEDVDLVNNPSPDNNQSEVLTTDLSSDAVSTEVPTSSVSDISAGKLLRQQTADHLTSPINIPDLSSPSVQSDLPAEQPTAQTPSDETEQVTQQPQNAITIQIRFLDDRQKVLQTTPDETIGGFKRIHFAEELAENFTVRFVFNGQELRGDNKTLRSYNVQDNSVIHCLLNRRAPAEEAVRPEQRAADLDLSFLMLPLFGLILLLIWYCRFSYKNYFNAMSTFSLVGITFLFIVAVMAAWRPHHGQHEHIE